MEWAGDVVAPNATFTTAKVGAQMRTVRIQNCHGA